MNELVNNEVECVEKEAKGVTKDVISDKNKVKKVEKNTVDMPKKSTKTLQWKLNTIRES